MVGSIAKRCAVNHVLTSGLGGVRAACRALELASSTFYYRPSLKQNRIAQEQRIVEISQKHPTLGYRKVGSMLRAEEGSQINIKRVARVRRQHGLLARRRGRKRRRIEGIVRERRVASCPDEVWSYDFIQDATVEGSRLRILSVIDEHSRQCLLLRAARSFPAEGVIDSLQEIMGRTGRKPSYLRSDNGPEFIATPLRQWLELVGIGPRYIEPGSPWENGHVESFHASLRAELLDREVFYSLNEANLMLEDWRSYYNYLRPHGALKYQPPCRPQRQSTFRPPASTPIAAGQVHL